MEQLFTETLLNKLPTLDHYRQLCHSLSVRNTPYNELNMTLINKVETIEKIQTHMLKIFLFKASFYNSTILSHIHHISTFKFYIAPNTYTNVLTLKQFFHCININYEIGRRRVKRCSYKYNIFYKGDRIDDIRTDTPQPPIERQYISCYGIPIIRPDKIEYDFRELPIEHFEQLLDIMDKDYVEDSSSFIGKKYEYISMYWEDKDVELFLNYIQKSQKYSKYSAGNYAENYLDCLEKNIQKNNYTQEKLTPLYEKYLKYETSTKVPYPVKYSVNEFYTGIANILKKYINFPVVRLGFDAAQSITPPQLNKLPSRVKKEESTSKIICIVPHLVYFGGKPPLHHEYTISDFIILESGQIIFRVKTLKNESYSYKCTRYDCDPNLFNKQVCVVMFSNRYTNRAYNVNDIDMAIYYDIKQPSKLIIGLQFMSNSSKILQPKSHIDFIHDFIEIENNKFHIYRLYMMSNSINKKNKKIFQLEAAPMPMGMAEETAPMPMGMAEETKSLERMHSIECASYVETIETLQKKCIELEKKCDAYAMACTALEMANAKLVERTKILDESNF